MPFIHYHVSNKGLAKACCVANITYGNANSQTLEEIWNGNAIKELRTKFLKNEIDNEFSTNSQIEKNPIFFHKKLDKIVQNVSEEEFSIINGIRNSHSISKASFNRWVSPPTRSNPKKTFAPTSSNNSLTLG